MIDYLKLVSKKLNIAVKAVVYLPDNYDHFDNILPVNYFILPRDLHLNQNLAVNQISVMIYPNNDIEKNKLLFDAFDMEYGYKDLYVEFIMKELKPLIEGRYRVSKNQADISIIGYNETAMLAFTMAMTYTDAFGKLYASPIMLDKKLISYALSKFNPNIQYHFYSKNQPLQQELYEKLIAFGVPKIELLKDDSINAILEQFQTL